MKLLLPIFATLGLFAAACSGGETAIEVETEIEEITDQSVEPQTTKPSAEDVEGPVAPTTRPEPPAETVGDVEQVVTDAEQVVTDEEDLVPPVVSPRSTETAVPIPAAISSGSQEEWNNNFLITQSHPHETVDGGRESHSHPYVKPASSHFHRDGAIIYLTPSNEEFVREDIRGSFWSSSGEIKKGGSVQCIEYCSHIDIALADGEPISTEIVTRVGEPTHRSYWECPSEEVYENVATGSGHEFENDPEAAGCELTERVPVE